MTPSLIQVATLVETPVVQSVDKTPLTSKGSLDAFEKFHVTSVIGTEFKGGVQIADLLKADNSNDLIRDLAILGTTFPARIF
jgi:proline racemase